MTNEADHAQVLCAAICNKRTPQVDACYKMGDVHETANQTTQLTNTPHKCHKTVAHCTHDYRTYVPNALLLLLSQTKAA
jgi:hypothetical protein